MSREFADRILTRSHSMTVPYGSSSLMASYPLEEVNFDFTPTLISQRRYYFTKSNIAVWLNEEELTTYLVETLPRKAFKGGFILVDPDTDDEIPEWQAINDRLEELDYYQAFLEIFQDARAYRTSLMRLVDNTRFQIVPGYKIVTVDENDFGDPTTFKVQTTSGITEYDARRETFYYIHARRRAWLQPIFSYLILSYWITYSMTEAAAREGSKFTQVKTKGLDDSQMNTVRARFAGLSARKIAVSSKEEVS